MPSGNREVIAYTVFQPADTVVIAKMYNMYGDIPGSNPIRNMPGVYTCIVPEDLDPYEVSITCRTGLGSGLQTLTVKNVNCRLIRDMSGTFTSLQILVTDETGTATDNVGPVEVTISRLPLTSFN